MTTSRRVLGAAATALMVAGAVGQMVAAVPAPAAPDLPTVTALHTDRSVHSVSGPSSGGTSVTVIGTGFVDVTAVEFAGVAASDVQVRTARSLTAIAPAHSGSGAVHVTVTTAAGKSRATRLDLFRYANKGPLTWTRTDHVDPPRLGSPTSISCPTANFCAAADRYGRVATFDGSAWTLRPDTITSGNGGRVACASPSFCLAVFTGFDGTDPTLVYDGNSWQEGPELSGLTKYNANYTIAAVACPSATYCLALTEGGFAARFDGTAWVSTTQFTMIIDFFALSCASANDCVAIGTDFSGKARLFVFGHSGKPARRSFVEQGRGTGIACPTVHLCLLPNDHGRVLTFDGLKEVGHTALTNTGTLGPVSCAAADDCRILGQLGTEYRYNGRSWHKLAHPVFRATVLTCAPQSKTCTALSNGAAVYRYTHGSWGGPRYIERDAGKPMLVSCVVTRCLGLDAAGTAFTYDGTRWTRTDAPLSPAIALSCVTIEYCAATDGYGFRTFDGRTWHEVPAPPHPGRTGLTALSCPAVGTCFATTQRQLLRFADGVWTRLLRDDHRQFAALSCPSTTFCAAGARNQFFDSGKYARYVEVWDGSAFHTFRPLDGSEQLLGISCTSPTFCAAVTSNFATAFDGTSWSPMRFIGAVIGDQYSQRFIASLTCTSSTFCAVLAEDGVATYDGSNWSLPTQLDSDPFHLVFQALSCASRHLCAVATSGGPADAGAFFAGK